MQAQLLTSAEIESLRDRVKKAEIELLQSQNENKRLQFRVICTQQDQNRLQAKGKSHIGKWAELARDSGLSVNRRKAVNRLWKEYKMKFGLARSYRDTPEFRFEEGLHWIDAWNMPDYLLENYAKVGAT